MDQSSKRFLACSLTVLAAAALSACPRQSPEARVLEARGNYTLEPTGFLVQELEAEEPVGEDEMPAEGEAAEAEAAASAMAGEEAVEGEMSEDEMMEEEMTPQGPRRVAVLFDLLVQYNATGDALPGITVEVVHKDPFEQEKGRHPTWVETPNLRKGETRQVPLRLEVDNYEDGDEFSVEWNAFVPPEKRGDYREFAEAAP